MEDYKDQGPTPPEAVWVVGILCSTAMIGVLALAACGPSTRLPPPKYPPTVTTADGNYTMNVYEFCYNGVKYLNIDRGISPKYVIGNDGPIIETCEAPK